MPEFLHIYISVKEGVAREEVEKKLSLALDWYRYAQGLYVLYTTSNVDKWKARLVDFVKPGGRLLIVRLDFSHRQGWMNKDFWEWIAQKQQAG